MVEVRTVNGPAVAPWLDELGRLRIEVFRDWPYLYAGDLDYERKYLATYARSPESLFVLALDGARVIGVRGYPPRPELVAELEWQEIGEPAPSRKQLSFWMRALR